MSRRVFVTGRAHGIGKSIVEAFAGRGDKVAFCDIDVVCAVIGINRATLVRAREGLRSRGFIRFEEGVQNSRAPT